MDASKMVMGTVVTQEDASMERLVAYTSQKLLLTETQYATIERKCLAIW